MTRGLKRCMMLHAPNNKLRNACHENSLNSWREQSFASLWKLATYIANLPRDRRVIRVLEGPTSSGGETAWHMGRCSHDVLSLASIGKLEICSSR